MNNRPVRRTHFRRAIPIRSLGRALGDGRTVLVLVVVALVELELVPMRKRMVFPGAVVGALGVSTMASVLVSRSTLSSQLV